MLQYAVKRL